MTYPILTDHGGALASSWGVAAPPTTFIVDSHGRVAEAFVGPLTADELDAKVAAVEKAG